jgi:hypothetical protein
MYSHSGATLSKMLECLIAKCKFAIGFCHSKKMYNVTIFFCDRTNVRSKLLLLGHLPNLVGHCPMSDSNLQPCMLLYVHLCTVTVK